MCAEVRGKRTAPSTPSSGYQIRRQPARVRERCLDVGRWSPATVARGSLSQLGRSRYSAGRREVRPQHLPSRADHALQHGLEGGPGPRSSPGLIMMMDKEGEARSCDCSRISGLLSWTLSHSFATLCPSCPKIQTHSKTSVAGRRQMERHLTGPSPRVRGKSPQRSGPNPNFKARSVSLYRPLARRPRRSGRS